MTSSRQDPIQYVMAEAMSYMYPAALRAATLLDVAAHLVDGPRDIAELARLTGTNGPFLRRVLRLLATHEIFREDEEGRFHLTPYADVLRADSPRTVRTPVLAMTSDKAWLPGGDLVEAVRHGEPGFVRHFGSTFFDYLRTDPEEARIFNESMVHLTAYDYEYLTGAYEFPGTGVMVDVGGGHGALLLRVLGTNPGLHGVLFDLEPVLAGHLLDQLGADDRWETFAGSFFEEVPTGDFHVLKNILHDWSDEECVHILGRVRRAMKPGGRLAVIDVVLPPANEPHIGKLQDIFMMLLFTGQERTRAEFENLFTQAGFRITKVVQTGGMYSVIEAEPAATEVTAGSSHHRNL